MLASLVSQRSLRISQAQHTQVSAQFSLLFQLFSENRLSLPTIACHHATFPRHTKNPCPVLLGGCCLPHFSQKVRWVLGIFNICRNYIGTESCSLLHPGTFLIQLRSTCPMMDPPAIDWPIRINQQFKKCLTDVSARHIGNL